LDFIKRIDKRTGWVITVIIHLGLLLFIFLNKGCVQIQDPPQFTLEELIVLDFSESGGGNAGAPPKTTPVEAESSSKEEATQEESPVETQSGNVQGDASGEEEAEVEDPKNDFSDLFGSGTSNSGSGSSDGSEGGMGTGDGPNTGGGVGDGAGRGVIGNPQLDNSPKWVGYVMVEFIIDRTGNVTSTKVLHPHPKTTITLSSSDKKFIEKDCKSKFKFTPSSKAEMKDRVFKRMKYALE
jgi:hypothetical protein